MKLGSVKSLNEYRRTVEHEKTNEMLCGNYFRSSTNTLTSRSETSQYS